MENEMETGIIGPKGDSMGLYRYLGLSMEKKVEATILNPDGWQTQCRLVPTSTLRFQCSVK